MPFVDSVCGTSMMFNLTLRAAVCVITNQRYANQFRTQQNKENSAESSNNKKDDDVKTENSEGNAEKDKDEGIHMIKICA